MRAKGRDERGFALVLAVLALALLTALGLSLAATTSMDLQVATNQRWSRQAYYNAESGLELGRAALRFASWSTVLPPARGVSWLPGGGPLVPLAPFTRASRNFENGACDALGAGAGYGVVLDDGSAPPLEYASDAYGFELRGATTVWVRRPLLVAEDGSVSDETRDDVLVLTAEGVAPFTRATATTTHARANAARTVLEARLRRLPAAIGWEVRVESVTQGSTVCK